MAINLPLPMWNAYPIAKRAWGVWRHERRLNVDFLYTLAIVASISQNQLLTRAVIAWLIWLGDWIRDLTAAGSKGAAGELVEFRQRHAGVARNGAIVEMPSGELVIDDVVPVYHREMILVDGEILDQRALIDQKTTTRESLPVMRAGEAAYAATIVREGQPRVGAATNAGQIPQLAEPMSA